MDSRSCITTVSLEIFSSIRSSLLGGVTQRFGSQSLDHGSFDILFVHILKADIPFELFPVPGAKAIRRVEASLSLQDSTSTFGFSGSSSLSIHKMQRSISENTRANEGCLPTKIS